MVVRLRAIKNSNCCGLDMIEVGNRTFELSQPRMMQRGASISRYFLQSPQPTNNIIQLGLAGADQRAVITGKIPRKSFP